MVSSFSSTTPPELTSVHLLDDITTKFWISYAWSFCTSAIAKVIFAPVDRTKLLLQCQGEAIRYGRLTEPYTGIRDVIQRVVAADGYLGLWRGNLANVLRAGPTLAVGFAFNDSLNSTFGYSKQQYGMWPYLFGCFMNGGVAGVLGMLSVYTLDFCRTRLACDVKLPATLMITGDKAQRRFSNNPREFSGIIDVYRKTIASDGIFGMHRGFGVTCVGIFVKQGVYFGLFEFFKSTVLPSYSHNPNDNIEPSDSLVFGLTFGAGWVSTATAQVCAYPFDTLRRRMIMTCGHPRSSMYKNAADCYFKVKAREGTGVLMKGCGLNLISSLGGAAAIATFDYFRPHLGH